MRVHVTDRSDRMKDLVMKSLLQAYDCAPGEVWLITPWLKDVQFSTDNLGPYRSLLGGYRPHVSFQELLKLLTRKHLLHVIVKPPHELVPIPSLKRIKDMDGRRRLILAREDLDYDVHDAFLATTEEELSHLKKDFLNHADTVLFAEALAHMGAQVYFRDALHAKLLWLPSGALFGSANFTNGGLSYNAELVAEVLDDDELLALKTAAEAIQADSCPRERYDLSDRDLVRPNRSLPSSDFFEYANDQATAHPDYRPILEYLGSLYR